MRSSKLLLTLRRREEGLTFAGSVTQPPNAEVLEWKTRGDKLHWRINRTMDWTTRGEKPHWRIER